MHSSHACTGRIAGSANKHSCGHNRATIGADSGHLGGHRASRLGEGKDMAIDWKEFYARPQQADAHVHDYNEYTDRVVYIRTKDRIFVYQGGGLIAIIPNKGQ